MEIDNFNNNNSNKYYYNETVKLKEEIVKLKNEIDKLKKIEDKFNNYMEKQKQARLKHSEKTNNILIHCDACNKNVMKSSWPNHTKCDTHIKNLQKTKTL